MRYFCGWHGTVCRAVKSSGFIHLIGAAEEGNGHRRPGKKPAKGPGEPAKGIGPPAKEPGVPAKGVGLPAKGPGVPAKGNGPPAKGPGVPAKGDEAEPMAWKGFKGEEIWKNKNEEGEEYK